MEEEVRQAGQQVGGRWDEISSEGDYLMRRY